MIDGFVQDQESTALSDQGCELQARTFTKGKFTRGAQGDVSFEEEVMQKVTCVCCVERCYSLYCLQCAVLRIEQFLLLCHVAEFARAAQAKRA